MRKRLFYTLTILLGIGGFCAMPFIVGLHDLLQTIGQVGWFWITLFVANASLTLLMPAVGWWVLMRAEGIPASLGTAVQANLMGFPLDFVVPSIYLGGEPLKMVYVSKVCGVTMRRALATIIVAKFQEFGGLVLGLIVVSALFVWHTDYCTQHHEALLLVALVVLTALFGLTLYAFAGRLKPIVTLITLLARLHVFQRQFAQLRTLAEDLEDRIHAACTNRIRSFILAQAITCLSAVSVFIRPWLFFQALPGPGIGFDQLSVFFVLTHLVNAFSIIPGALGLFEATMAGYASAAGLGDDKGAAFAIVNRIADLTLLVIGCWLIVYYGLSRVARSQKGAAALADATDVQSTAARPFETTDPSQSP